MNMVVTVLTENVDVLEVHSKEVQKVIKGLKDIKRKGRYSPQPSRKYTRLLQNSGSTGSKKKGSTIVERRFSLKLQTSGSRQ